VSIISLRIVSTNSCLKLLRWVAQVSWLVIFQYNWSFFSLKYLKARSVDREKTAHVNRFTLNFRESEKEKSYHQDFDFGFTLSMGTSLLILILSAGLQVCITMTVDGSIIYFSFCLQRFLHSLALSFFCCCSSRHLCGSQQFSCSSWLHVSSGSIGMSLKAFRWGWL
jgi:hypothetical protein